MKNAWLVPLGLVLSVAGAYAQQPVAPVPIDRVKITDNELTCAQIHGEIGQMDKIVGDARAVEDKERTSANAAGAAGTAAEIAGRSGLFGALGGLTGALLGQAATQTAAGAVQQSSAQSAAQAATRAREARARKEHLTSLFLAKECKASDPNAPGKTLSGEEMQKVAGIAPSDVAAGPADVPPLPTEPQAVNSLITRAADAARSGLTPVTLGIGPGMDFESLVAKAQKVVVAGYRVAFVTRNSASAYAGAGIANIGQSTGYTRTITQAQNKKIEVGLMNVNRPLMQAIADQLYADFVAQLKAGGRTVVTFEEIAQSPAVAALERAETKPGEDYTASPTGDARNYTVLAPTGQPLYFFAGEQLGDKGPFSQGNNKTIGTIAGNAQAVALVPMVVIDFAEVASSGRSTFRSNASVEAKPGVALVPMHTVLWAAFSGNPIITEMGSKRLENVIAFPGDYASVRDVENFDTASLANSLTRISGTQGVQFFREKKAYVADPGKFADLALRGGFSANRAFAAAAKASP
ncbi:MAG: hypothetical protein AB7O69_11090 [Burkholderiales bacterium]